MGKVKLNRYKNGEILDLIKNLVSLIIANENKKHTNQNFTKEYSEIIKSKFLKYKKEDILYLLRRHRLLPLLSSSKLTNFMLPNLRDEINYFYSKEIYKTLFISFNLLQINELLSSKKIPFIVIKGIPLSIQTSNNVISRGSGDIDIFIDPTSTNKVCEILEERGFRKSTPHIDYSNSIIGRYITFVSPEVKFQKKDLENNFTLELDIHWRLSWVKGPNPSFWTAWNRKTQIILNNQKINVLSIEDAFLHSCLHAAQDEFNSIRSLVDIERLSRKLDKKRINKLSKFKVVRNACCVSFDCTNSERLKSFYESKDSYFNNLINKSKKLQLRKSKYMLTSEWTFKNRIRVGFRILQFTNNPIDWLRVIFFNFLNQEDFVNYAKNQIIYNPLIIFKLRFKRLLEKIRVNFGYRL